MFAEMTQDHSHVLTNLATVTQYDRDTVANMSKTIADLTLQLRQSNTKLAEAQSSIATLTSKLAKTGAKSNHFSTSPTTATSSSRYNNRFLKDGYCWSHGFKVTHNSIGNAAMFAEMTQDHSHVLTNLATVTQYDRDTAANMSTE